MLATIPTLFGISLLVFGFLHLIPGDPALAILGERATEESVARVRAGTKVSCMSVPRQDFLALVESEPALALRMLRELARRLSEASLDA